MFRLDLQPSYVLHTRPFKETSLIADILTQDDGLQSVLIKGAKRPKSRFKGLIIPFVPLIISAVGRTDLLTLTLAEPRARSFPVQGKNLLSGMYLNELVIKLMPRFDSHPKIFEAYEATISALKEFDLNQTHWSLRRFEYTLLKDLGYGLDFQFDGDNQPISADSYYDYQEQKGLVRVGPQAMPHIEGHALLSFAKGETTALNLSSLKWLMRKAMASVLNGKKLYTRELARYLGEMS